MKSPTGFRKLRENLASKAPLVRVNKSSSSSSNTKSTANPSSYRSISDTATLDGSQSSTFTVPSAPQKRSPVVQFSDSVRVREIMSHKDMRGREKRSRWMSRIDLMDAQREARCICKAIFESAMEQQRQRHQQQHDTNNTSSSPADPASFVTSHRQAYTSCAAGITPSAMEVENLSHWAKTGGCLRGLEKMGIPGLNEHRSNHIHQYRRAVLLMYRTSRQSSDGSNEEEHAENLRKAAMKLSKCDRLYARALGKADRNAAEATVLPGDECMKRRGFPECYTLEDSCSSLMSQNVIVLEEKGTTPYLQFLTE